MRREVIHYLENKFNTELIHIKIDKKIIGYKGKTDVKIKDLTNTTFSDGYYINIFNDELLSALERFYFKMDFLSYEMNNSDYILNLKYEKSLIVKKVNRIDLEDDLVKTLYLLSFIPRLKPSNYRVGYIKQITPLIREDYFLNMPLTINNNTILTQDGEVTFNNLRVCYNHNLVRTLEKVYEESSFYIVSDDEKSLLFPKFGRNIKLKESNELKIEKWRVG